LDYSKTKKRRIRMIRRIFSVIVCLSVLMLCNCKPGNVCGPGKIIDCYGDCVDGSDIDSALGDGTCDGNLNCSEFNYDDGDCSNDNETTTTTPTSTTTSQPDDEGDPTLTGWRMEAQLVVHFVCILPPIDETATIALSGYENGDVIGENGFFVYYSDADFCNGGNYHRDGQWDINPYGRMVIHNGGHWLELNENTYHIDNIIIECPPGTTQPPIQEDGTWNEGLFMQIVDGAHNTITNERGDEISWTLQGVAEIEMLE
jgi:hypothetical protein